jgi:hypothetical protein
MITGDEILVMNHKVAGDRCPSSPFSHHYFSSPSTITSWIAKAMRHP